MRILVAVACLLPFALAAEAAINRQSPDAAVKAAYAADQVAIDGHGAGVMSDNTLRARYFSRSLLRSIAANEAIADAQCAAGGRRRSPHRRGAPYRGSARRPDHGKPRHREGVGRVRPRRRRSRAADLRHGLRARRVADRRHRLRNAGRRKPQPARPTGRELKTSCGPPQNSRERSCKSRMRHKAK